MPVRLATNSEASLQKMVTDYLRLRYPGVIFRSDFASGLKLTMGQAVAHKRLQHSRAFPDLQILEPIGNYHGLFLELKKEGTRVYLKDGSLSTDPHIQEQAAMLRILNSKGYKAEFAIGWSDAVSKIDNYFGLINGKAPITGAVRGDKA